MKEYYTVIYKESLIKLLKFGRAKSFRANMLEVTEDNIKLKNILKKIDFLSGEEEEVIILKINNENTEMNIEEWYQINIENVQNYYLLSYKAQQFYHTKISSKLNFELFPDENILNDLEEEKEIEDMERGAEILLKQFGFNNKKQFDKSFVKEVRLFLQQDNYLKIEYKKLEFDLLSYRRKNKFQKEELSYIFDLIMILHLKDRKEERISKFNLGLIELEKSPTCQLLKKNKKDDLLQYINFIENSDEECIKKFIDQITIEKLVIGVLFLKFKHIKEIGNINKIRKDIELFNVKYNKEVMIALYFIGLIFGYENLRHEYYDYIGCYNFRDEDTIVKELFETGKAIIEKKKEIQNSLLNLENTQGNITDKISKIMKEKNSNINIKKNMKSTSIRNKNKTIINIEEKSFGKLKIEMNFKNINEREKNKIIIENLLKQLDEREIKYDNKTKKYILNFYEVSKLTQDNLCNFFKEIII